MVRPLHQQAGLPTAPEGASEAVARMKAAIYCRLSLDREGETSTERQEADCRAYAASRGWEVVSTYRDRISGFKDVHRPDYERFMADLRSGRVDVGIVWKLDRLTRKGLQGVAEVLDALKAGGSSLASVTENIDTTSAAGELVLGVMASIAKQESQNTSLRTKRARLQEAQRGASHSGGRKPFGYLKGGMAEDPEEAELVREAARRVLAGESCSAVARDWQKRGVASLRHNVLRDILLGARIRGVRMHQGTPYPAAWPALVDKETADALEHVWGKMPTRRPPRRYLLTGVLRCAECGGPLNPAAKHPDPRRKTQGDPRRYRCNPAAGTEPCYKVTVAARPSEELVERAVRAGLEHLEVLVSAGSPEIGPLLSELEDRKARLGRAQDLFVSGDLPRGRYEALKDALLGDIAALQGRIESAGALPEAVSGVEAWEAWDLDRRRQAVRAVFPRIVVDKGSPGPFKAGRMRFMDRDGAAWRVWADSEGFEELRPENPADRRFLRL